MKSTAFIALLITCASYSVPAESCIEHHTTLNENEQTSNARASMKLSVKSFQNEHLKGLTSLITHIQEGEFHLPLSPEQHEELKNIPNAFQFGNGNYWIALDGERVIGSMAAFDIGHNELQLRDVFVHEEYRGKAKGVSRKLLDTVLSWAKERAIEKIYLGTAPVFLAAHRFYEKSGFTEIRKEDLPKYISCHPADTKFFRYDVQPLKIVTVDSLEKSLLRTKAEWLQEDELPLANQIAKQLIKALEPYFPAAGLAAPQIGINKAVFIYSFDRDPKNLEVVINPSFTPIGELIEKWEACFSTILCEKEWKVAKVARYQTIKVTYLNQEGRKIEKTLSGFAAKVFQHEYDHLLGIVNIDRPDAMVKAFDSKEEMLNFMQEVKRQDALR